CARGTGWFDYW
nr:immunoglobulin heavy chain junction region [Mus musculus]